MPLGNLTSGQPFKTALRVCLAFLLIYGLAGVVLVRAVEDTIKAELAAQTTSETVLLRNIYRRQGRAGLEAALAELNRAMAPGQNIAGLFDENGLSLTGPIARAPEVLGVARREVTTLTRGQVRGSYVLVTEQIEKLTLVIGRNARIVETATRRLSLGLVIFGAGFAALILALGLWASRISYGRLNDMEAALFRVSDGDLEARLPVLPGNDQFDRVSVRMNQNLDRLARLVKVTKSTASAIAHDLKTPLSHAQIALNEAADAAEGGQDALPRIEAALTEVHSLNTVFDTMLRISRIEASEGSGDFSPIDLAPIAGKVVEFMRPAAEEGGQTLELDAPPVEARVDAAMIEQLLVNLVANAVKHAGEGARIAVTLSDDAGHAVLRVTDTGPGIPSEERNKVLEPFTRLDSARTTQGSGLGLALVRAVVEHHEAVLTLSDAGPGLTVEVRFAKLKKS